MVTVEEVRAFARLLPRTTEHLIYDRVKFRVGRIVYVAFSRDETEMGFAFPKEEREMLVESEPHKFLMPTGGDLRWNWVVARVDALDADEMRELVLDAWRMVVPKKVAATVERPAEACATGAAGGSVVACGGRSPSIDPRTRPA